MNTHRFEALPIPLDDLLEGIGNGRIQLPDFQRGWVWDDYNVRSLIASISQAFPIGAIMTLGTGNPHIRFKTRFIEGVNPEYAQNEPQELILDGQQRLTALFQSLSAEDLCTLDAESKRHYYLDMNGCLEDNVDREDAIRSCGKDLQLQTYDNKNIDLRHTENPSLIDTAKEYANDIFPAYKTSAPDDWMVGYFNHWNFNPEKINFFNDFRNEVLRRFDGYAIPVIRLNAGTPREAVCQVFEKVNTRGVPLTVFELLTAIFAADNFQLRDDWNKRAKDLNKFPVLKGLDNTSFLRALSLLVNSSCRRRDILQLKVQDYEQKARKVQDGFSEAAKFLNRRKIFSARDVPYQTQLVPLAAILAELGNEGMTIGAEEKITRWYWCGVLGEMYAGSIDSRVANDFSEVIGWIQGNSDEPVTIQEANFQTNRVLELRTRGSAAYKGSYALLIAQGCHDFLMERTTEDMERDRDDIDIHHIFPRKWCREHKIKKEVYDSIINKTPLSSRANKKIGGRDPSKYLPRIQEDAGIDNAKMDKILASHLISANALRKDDFWSFFEARKKALLEVIEKAMGKKVIRDGDEEQTDVLERLRDPELP